MRGTVIFDQHLRLKGHFDDTRSEMRPPLQKNVYLRKASLAAHAHDGKGCTPDDVEKAAYVLKPEVKAPPAPLLSKVYVLEPLKPDNPPKSFSMKSLKSCCSELSGLCCPGPGMQTSQRSRKCRDIHDLNVQIFDQKMRML